MRCTVVQPRKIRPQEDQANVEYRLRRDVLTNEPARRNIRPFIILGCILLLIGLACFGYWLENRGFATTDDAEIDGAIYTISPQIPGRVRQVMVDDNQHVAAGQVLVTLDDRDMAVALARARAQRAQAQAQVGVAAADVAQAQATVAQNQASLMQAEQDFARYHAINPNATTRQQIDAANAATMGARAKVAASTAALSAAQAGLAAARAAAEVAGVAVRDADLQRSYTVITAPAAGYVAQKTVEPGNVVAAGTPMMAIVGDDVWVTANYKETQLPGIRVGDKASIEVDAAPGVAFSAHVQSVQDGTGTVFSVLPAENATGNYIKIVQRVPVKLVFDDPRAAQYRLSPGMSVTPSITIGP